ncbi:MAG: phenylalanine 4-monooxygenase [Motiliproteus sp.]
MQTNSHASHYQARLPAADGRIHYDDSDHATWQQLIQRQMSTLPNRACDAYLLGLEQLALPHDRIPQLKEINQVLQPASGWQVVQVPALISFDQFFTLLANQQFPVATFIRSQQEIDYLQEPDVFHEIFGHCPMLMQPDFAQFTHCYGKLGLRASPQDRAFLARLYWLTVEFGLIDSSQGIRIYGGGILSSYAETRYCLLGDGLSEPQRKDFALLEVLRTPYRIDIQQPIYYVIDRLETLYQLTRLDLMAEVIKAKRLGLLKPLFPT